MRGVDTNVLLRLLVGDDEIQQRRAAVYLHANCTENDPAFVNRVVLSETVWNLERSYRYPRNAVASAIERVLGTSAFEFKNPAVISAALSAYKAGADFPDALIAATNEAAGCETTLTFDVRAAKRLAHFQLIP